MEWEKFFKSTRQKWKLTGWFVAFFWIIEAISQNISRVYVRYSYTIQDPNELAVTSISIFVGIVALSVVFGYTFACIATHILNRK